MVLVRLGDLARESGDDARLAETLAQIVESGGPEAWPAGVELAVMAQAGPDAPVPPRTADVIARLVQQDDGAVPGSRRAELAWRLAGVLEQRRDEDGTLHWLRVSLEGGADGLVAVAAWRRFVEIAARRGDAAAAAQGLVAWADDPRTGEGERERATHLVAAADIFRERLGLVADALVLLERALGLDPLNDKAFGTLDTLASDTEDWPRLGEVLARRVEVARPAEQKGLLGRLGALLAGPLERPADAAAVYDRLLRLDPDALPALLFGARHLWSRGEHPDSVELYRRVAALEGPAPDLAEASLRLAQWAHRQGEDFEPLLARALASEPKGAPLAVLVEALEELERQEELVLRLSRRDEEESDPALQAPVRRARAGLLERMGRVGEAIDLYGTLVDDEPERQSAWALSEQAEVFRRERHLAELVPIIERLGRQARSDLDAEVRGLELAGLLARLGEKGRAEDVLRRLVERLPGAAAPLEALSALLAARGATAEADAALLRRLELPGEDQTRARLLAARGREVLRLCRRADLPPARAMALLEELLAAPRDGLPAAVLAEALAEAQGRLPDHRERLRALGQLLERGLPLSGQTRARIQVALAEEAERDGDLTLALGRFEGALGESAPPEDRALQLVGRARVRLQRREVEAAVADVSDALELAPDHAPAVALRAELAFRQQDWAVARESYGRLATLPDGATAIAPALLAFRRGLLAEKLGDEGEAEAAYRQVAEMDAAHVEAREALGALALGRGELSEAAGRFEEVVRLAPDRREVGRRLADIYLQLGDDPAARRTLEAVLAGEPERREALEALLGIYERDGLDGPAAALCERLARLYPEPELRARAYFRQGEILRERVGDAAAAGDAYLRALDLDPSHAPTVRRVIEHLWSRGDFAGVTEVAAELGSEDPGEPVSLMVAVAAAIADPRSPAGERLAEWMPAQPVSPRAWTAGALDHPAARGPLRRALRALAPALAGFGPLAEVGAGLPIETPPRIEELRARLGAPPFRMVLATDVSGAVALGTRPVTVAMRPDLSAEPAAELRFLAARALEEARSGTFVVRALDGAALTDLLRSVAAVLGAVPGRGTAAVAAWLGERDTAALLPQGSARAQLVADLREILAHPIDREGFLRGSRFSTDRVAVLACGKLPAALRAMAAADGGTIAAEPVRELCAFLLSDECRGLVS
jgi:tetratricopeptide (TPR) repeat protein